VLTSGDGIAQAKLDNERSRFAARKRSSVDGGPQRRRLPTPASAIAANRSCGHGGVIVWSIWLLCSALCRGVSSDTPL